MERDEELTNCADCGAEISPATDRAFAVNDDVYICFECALKRGGVFDEKTDRWTSAPNVENIADERRVESRITS